MENSKNNLKVPYLSASKMDKLMELVSERSLSNIKTTYFKPYGFGHADAYLAINSLRFLGLINEDGTEFTFPSETIFPALSTLIIARDVSGFNAAFSNTADFEMALSLANTGDEISLYDNINNLLDAVAWGDGSTEGANNPISVAEFDDGESLQRVPIDNDTDDITADFIFAEADPKNEVMIEESSSSSSETGEETTGFIVFYFTFSMFLIVLVYKKK